LLNKMSRHLEDGCDILPMEVFQFMKNALLIFTTILGLLCSSVVFAQDEANNVINPNDGEESSSVGFSIDKGALISNYTLFQEIRTERKDMKEETPGFKRFLAKMVPGVFLKQDSDLKTVKKELKSLNKRYKVINSENKSLLDDLVFC
jgi:hypothetical protein